MLSNAKLISLWLLPPDPHMATLRAIQSEIIANHPERRLPEFQPHVTLIGGVPISQTVTDEELASRRNDSRRDDVHEVAAAVLLRRLRAAFRAHGGVACEFVAERGAFAARHDGAGDEGGGVPWNQSCVSVVQRNASFVRALRVADEAMFATTRETQRDGERPAPSIERHFKPPLFEPHYSFAYGNDANLIPESLTCPSSFTSHELVLMWTCPASLDAVEKWEPIGRICLI